MCNIVALSLAMLVADFFVITDTFKSQQEAQMRAAAVGGWTLDTDVYAGLGPNLFAVVRGPYASKQVAEQKLQNLKRLPSYRGAYVKDAGALRVPAGLFGAVDPKILTALLGELSVIVKDRAGGANGCEPDEPYREVTVSVVTLERKYDEKEGDRAVPRRIEVDLGAFRVIKRTGEIERMRVCME